MSYYIQANARIIQSDSCAYQEEKKTASNLDEINQLWLSSYAQRKALTKHSLGKEKPVILLTGNDLVLRYKGEREVHPYVPEEYHQLKAIGHISCLIHTLLRLRQSTIVPLDIESREAQAKSLLSSMRLTGSLEKYQPIIQEYRAILEERDCARLQNLKGSLDGLIDAAAKSRLDSLHRTTQSIRERISKEGWKNVSVIVLGPQMPRQGELGMQYYESILDIKHPQAGCPYHMQLDQNLSHQRLIYAESIYDEEGALDFLTTHICDEDLGKDLLGDKEAMYADILKDATAKHLKTLHQQ